jgi:hypothetical protein
VAFLCDTILILFSVLGKMGKFTGKVSEEDFQTDLERRRGAKNRQLCRFRKTADS